MVFAELFGLDVAGNLWHVESSPPSDSVSVDDYPSSSFQELSDGSLVVNDWTTPFMVFPGPIQGFTITSNTDGQPFIALVSTGGVNTLSSATATVSIAVQDPNTSDWTTTLLSQWTETTTQAATKRSAYYFEASVEDANRLAMPGQFL
jgi:hypothetical protein